MKRMWTFAIVTMVLLTPLDVGQVMTGVQTVGHLTHLSWLLFLGLGALLGVVSRLIPVTPDHYGLAGAPFDGVKYVFGAYLVTFYYGSQLDAKHELVVVAVLATLFFIQALFTIVDMVSWREWLPWALLLGIGGPLFEMALVNTGATGYVQDTLFEVPLWLPLLWANGAFLARNLSSYLAGNER